MLSCSLLLKLPSDWQLKMHNEIASKLKICISDMEIARNVATETWQYLSQDNFNKNELSLKLKPYLSDHALDFTDWVMDFAQKSIEYYLETVSNVGVGNIGNATTMGSSTSTIMSSNGSSVNRFNFNGSNISSDGLGQNVKEYNSRVFKNALKDIRTQNSLVHSQSSDSLGSSIHYSDKSVGNTDSSIKFSNRAMNSSATSVDPLDDTLDNLILKEKIAKLQGQKSITLGVQTKSGKFQPSMEPEFDMNVGTGFTTSFSSMSSRRLKPKPLFRNLTLVNVDQPSAADGNGGLASSLSSSSFGSFTSATGVAKVPKLCMNFPNCQFGDNCRYIHPNKICKNWPNCFYGDKCAFIHPNK